LVGTVVDLSKEGCQVVLARGQRIEIITPETHLRIAIHSASGGGDFICPAVVKRIRNLKALFRSRISLGLLFEKDQAEAAGVRQLIAGAREAEQKLF
jgi:hypothetical protein